MDLAWDEHAFPSLLPADVLRDVRSSSSSSSSSHDGGAVPLYAAALLSRGTLAASSTLAKRAALSAHKSR